MQRGSLVLGASTTPGIRIGLYPTDNLTLLLGLFNGNPAGPGLNDPQQRDRTGLLFRTGDPAFVIGEAQFKYGDVFCRVKSLSNQRTNCEGIEDHNTHRSDPRLSGSAIERSSRTCGNCARTQKPGEKPATPTEGILDRAKRLAVEGKRGALVYIWSKADAEAQPVVARARAALAALR